jgi:hypothetical protein
MILYLRRSRLASIDQHGQITRINPNQLAESDRRQGAGFDEPAHTASRTLQLFGGLGDG